MVRIIELHQPANQYETNQPIMMYIHICETDRIEMTNNPTTVYRLAKSLVCGRCKLYMLDREHYEPLYLFQNINMMDLIFLHFHMQFILRPLRYI